MLQYVCVREGVCSREVIWKFARALERRDGYWVRGGVVKNLVDMARRRWRMSCFGADLCRFYVVVRE